MEYKFYYDESEHSRKINYQTITASNFYDNFVTVIVGWDSARECQIKERYEAFEEKYKDRASHGELKSTTIKQNQFKYGFSSLNKQNAQLLEDFLSVFTEDIHVYFSVISKVEYILRQILEEYADIPFIHIRAMEYSLTKAILAYKPMNVLKSIDEQAASEIIVKEIVKFLNERINYDVGNVELKEREIKIFTEIMGLLNSVNQVKQTEWNYEIPFAGFQLYLEEKNIENYTVILDKEGDCQNTLNAAKRMNLKNASEGDSKDYFGIRMSDMLAGLITKMMKSLSDALRTDSTTEKPVKKLLGEHWFVLNEKQLDLYKKMYYIILKLNDAWYKSLAGVYADDLIAFIGLLEYMDQYNCIEDMKKQELKKQPEYFNTHVCLKLEDRFKDMGKKVSFDQMSSDDEYFFNDRGGKIYFDIEKQSVLHITGKDKYKVLSVGIHSTGKPVATVETEKGIQSYVLPDELFGWALTLINWASQGINLLPAEVIFSKQQGRYSADIL